MKQFKNINCSVTTWHQNEGFSLHFLVTFHIYQLTRCMRSCFIGNFLGITSDCLTVKSLSLCFDISLPSIIPVHWMQYNNKTFWGRGGISKRQAFFFIYMIRGRQLIIYIYIKNVYIFKEPIWRNLKKKKKLLLI